MTRIIRTDGLEEAEQAFITAYETSRADLPGINLPWMAALRDGGMEAWRTAGFPNRRVEEYKYTDLRANLRTVYGEPSGDSASLPEDPFAAVDAYTMVFVDGRFRADLSRLEGLPAGIDCLPMGQALEQGVDWLEGRIGTYGLKDQHPGLHGLNIALMRDGAAIRVSKGFAPDKPVRLVFAVTGGGMAVHVRNLVVVEDGARLDLLETHLGTGSHLVTEGTDIQVHDKGQMTHVKIQDADHEAAHGAASYVRIGREARYEGFAFSSGGALSRNEVFTRFETPFGFARVSGAALLTGTQHCDNTTVIDHAQPDCESHETFKSVVADRGRSVFQGKIIVQRDAQRTDGYQLSQGLLLNPGAEVDTKPELEIYADDVKCSHGATVGELDENALFYLRSRGIDEGDAKALLIRAFVAEVLAEIPSEPLADAAGAHLDRWLEINRDRVRAAESGTLGFDEEESNAA